MKRRFLIFIIVFFSIVLAFSGWCMIESKAGARPLFYLSDAVVSSVDRIPQNPEKSSYLFEYYEIDQTLSEEEEKELLSFLRSIEPGEAMDPDPISERLLMRATLTCFLIHTPLRQIPVGIGITGDAETYYEFIVLGKRFYRVTDENRPVLEGIAQFWGRNGS